MAKLRFEIDGEPSYVAFSTFLTATQKLKQLLREIDQVISGRYGGSLQWYVAALTSKKNLGIEVLSRLKRTREATPPIDFGSDVAASLVTGLDNVQNRNASPPYLSEYGLRHMEEMLNVLARNGAKGYRATDIEHDKTVVVSQSAAQTIRELLPIRRSAIGSVEGKLEAISIHRGPTFIVYQGLTNKAIRCAFDGSDVMMETVKSILGKRVVASGIVHSNIKAEPMRVDVEDIRVLGDGPLPRTQDLTGSHPDIADGLSTDDYIRSIRE